MNQANLDRAVARATGETITQIRRLGFSLMVPDTSRYEPLPHILRCKRPHTHRRNQNKRAA